MEPLDKSLWVEDKYAVRCRACDEPFTFYRRRHHCRYCGQVFCFYCLGGPDAEKHPASASGVKKCRRCAASLHRHHMASLAPNRENDNIMGLPQQHPSPIANAPRATTVMDVSVPTREEESLSTPLTADPSATATDQQQQQQQCVGLRGDCAHFETIEEKSILYAIGIGLMPTNKKTAGIQNWFDETPTPLADFVPSATPPPSVKGDAMAVADDSILDEDNLNLFRTSSDLKEAMNHLFSITTFPPEALHLSQLEALCVSHWARRMTSYLSCSPPPNTLVVSDRMLSKCLSSVYDATWATLQCTSVALGKRIIDHVEVVPVVTNYEDHTVAQYCEVLSGVVITRSPTSSRMPIRHDNPRILLVRGDVTYSSEKNDDMVEYVHTYRGYLDKLYQRIHIWSPQVIMVEGGMHHYLQDRIAATGSMTLFVNVGETVIERVATCTGARIIADLQYVISSELKGEQSPLGVGNCFRACSDDGAQLFILEGPINPTRTSIVVRGECDVVTLWMQQLLGESLRVAYHLCAEAHLYDDLGADTSFLLRRYSMAATRELLNSKRTSVSHLTSQCLQLDKERHAHSSLLSISMGVSYKEQKCKTLSVKQVSQMQDTLVVQVVELDRLRQAERHSTGTDTPSSPSPIQDTVMYSFYHRVDDATVYETVVDAFLAPPERRILMVHGGCRVIMSQASAAPPSSPHVSQHAREHMLDLYQSHHTTKTGAMRMYVSLQCGDTTHPLTAWSPHSLNISFGAFLELLCYGSGEWWGQGVDGFAMTYHLAGMHGVDNNSNNVVCVQVSRLQISRLVLEKPPVVLAKTTNDKYREDEVRQLGRDMDALGNHATALCDIIYSVEASATSQQQGEKFLALPDQVSTAALAIQSLCVDAAATCHSSAFLRWQFLRPQLKELLACCNYVAGMKNLQQPEKDSLHHAKMWIALQEEVLFSQVEDDTSISEVRLTEPSSIIALALSRLYSFTSSPCMPYAASGLNESESESRRTERNRIDLVELPYNTQSAVECLLAPSQECKNTPADLAAASSTPISQSHVLPRCVSPIAELSRAIRVELLFAKSFAALQFLTSQGDVAALVASLKHCKTQNPDGGKSNAAFYKTIDGRFLLKRIKWPEWKHFTVWGPQYFHHVAACYGGDSPGNSVLAKIIGMYAIHITRREAAGGESGGSDECHFYAVIENLIPPPSQGRVVYDLKGSQRSRTAPEGSRVLLDGDLVQRMAVGNGLYCSWSCTADLMQSIRRDVSLLSSVAVMDYSLLVIVEKKNSNNSGEGAESSLRVGIIDYLHPFTGVKLLESKVKSGLDTVMGYAKIDPTIIDPVNYQNRFLVWMERYICAVPDRLTVAVAVLSSSRDDLCDV